MLVGIGAADEAWGGDFTFITPNDPGRQVSEEIALTGEQIGNFPQAFTHLALIDAAITLDRQLDLRSAASPTTEI
jgi:hypothetical protein